MKCTFKVMHTVSVASLIVNVVTINDWMAFFMYKSLMHLS